MHHDTEIVFSSDGINWIAETGVEERLVACDLETLDAQVRDSLERMLNLSAGDSVTAFFRFDNVVIPEWIRQYSDHYFNRIVEFKY